MHTCIDFGLDHCVCEWDSEAHGGQTSWVTGHLISTYTLTHTTNLARFRCHSFSVNVCLSVSFSEEILSFLQCRFTSIFLTLPSFFPSSSLLLMVLPVFITSQIMLWNTSTCFGNCCLRWAWSLFLSALAFFSSVKAVISVECWLNASRLCSQAISLPSPHQRRFVFYAFVRILFPVTSILK